MSVFPGAPPALAGIGAGDVIVSFAGRTITNDVSLTVAVRAARPGQRVTVELYRGPTLPRSPSCWLSSRRRRQAQVEHLRGTGKDLSDLDSRVEAFAGQAAELARYSTASSPSVPCGRGLDVRPLGWALIGLVQRRPVHEHVPSARVRGNEPESSDGVEPLQSPSCRPERPTAPDVPPRRGQGARHEPDGLRARTALPLRARLGGRSVPWGHGERRDRLHETSVCAVAPAAG